MTTHGIPVAKAHITSTRTPSQALVQGICSPVLMNSVGMLLDELEEAAHQRACYLEVRWLISGQREGE